MAGSRTGRRKDRRGGRHGGRRPPRQAATRRAAQGRAAAALAAAPGVLLHPRRPEGPPWKLLWPLLGLAFAARAGVALAGDFAMHPDEIMQYLEQAHRLVFGNGIVFWEQFYGARSWLIPGLVAGILALFDAAGLGEPAWYVDGVKLAFCALSLMVPAGMYFFARWHFGEASARVALVAGAFWYELAGFAHKPMTEFVATALLMALLALCARPAPQRAGTVWAVAALAVLVAAVRMQYAPLALVLPGLFFLRAGAEPADGGRWWRGTRAQLGLAAALCLAAVGAFDAASWGGGPFHSYLANLRFNLALEEVRAGSSPAWQYLWWSLLASAGLAALCLAAALRDLRRYGLLLGLIALVLAVHSAEAHKEYRFVFVTVPLWLLIGADAAARLAARAGGRRAPALGAAVFAAVSLTGLLNALPGQDGPYRLVFAPEETPVRFVRDQDPLFAAYRYLAAADGVRAVWQVDRHYHGLPGYYYLHRRVPLYDAVSGAEATGGEAQAAATLVSHVVSADPALSVPGYGLERAFGEVRILRRLDDGAAVRQWQSFSPTPIPAAIAGIMARLYPDAPSPPPDFGIRFAADPPPAGLPARPHVPGAPGRRGSRGTSSGS